MSGWSLLELSREYSGIMNRIVYILRLFLKSDAGGAFVKEEDFENSLENIPGWDIGNFITIDGCKVVEQLFGCSWTLQGYSCLR